MIMYAINNVPAMVDHSDPWEPYIHNVEDAFKPRPAAIEIVQSLLPCPSLSILFGAPGTLKSFQLADLAACVASGKQWLEPLNGQQCGAFKTTQSGVFLLDYDNGKRPTNERIEALARAYKLSKYDPLYYASMPIPWLDSSDIKEMEQFGMRMEQREVKLVVVDNLGVVSGGADENSIKMASVMSNWRRLAEDHSLAVILIHHRTKGSDKPTSKRTGDSLRGHSSIEAALDLALLAERKEQSPIVSIRSTKVRGSDVAPFSAMFTYAHKPGTSELQEARFWGVPPQYRSSTHQIEQTIL